MDDLLKDLRYSLRAMLQHRAFAIAAITALALGIGATTAVFSVVNAVLLRPFPYPDPDRIVFFMNTFQQGSGRGASPVKFAHWRRQTDVVRDASAFHSTTVNYTGGDTPQQLTAGQVSADFFRLLGANTLLGRTFTEAEDLPNGPHVAVLSYAFWNRRFASDATIIGRTISLSGAPYVVVGVLAGGFDPSEITDTPDLWIPFQLDPNTADGAHYFSVIGRLAAGVTLPQANERLKRSADEFRRRFPDALGANASFGVAPIQEVLVRGSRSLLTILLAVVAGVLLIACANVANLLLIRATTRRREIAVRVAMGAERGRIVRQLLTESVLLAAVGGVAGLGLGLLGIRVLLSINTAGLPRLGDGGSLVGLDWRLLAFAAAVSIVTGMLFGLVPAISASRGDLVGALREGSGASGRGVGHNRMRSGLVVLELALALMLVVGSGLLIRTWIAIRAVSPGFDGRNVLTMQMSFSGPQFAQTASVDRVIRDGIDRLRATPGVEVGSATCCLPLEGGYGLPFTIVGRPLTEGKFHGGSAWVTVAPGYFEVFKIPVIRGRTFTDRDNGAGPPVAIINESMAKQYWKAGNPLNDRLAIGRGGMREFAAEPDRQIIGVVADSRDQGLSQEPGPKIFTPQGQMTDLANALNMRISPVAWVVRTRVSPLSLSRVIQDQLRQATGLPVTNIRTMSQIVSQSTSREQFNMLLMALFAATALALATIGISGVVAYSVQQRTQEIGVRLALGANSGAVRMMVLLQGMRLAIIGIVLGVIAAFLLTRFLSSQMYGVEPHDPAVFIGVSALLTLVALLAVWIPAARASRVDPLVAMRPA